MKTKLNGILTLLLALVVQVAFAQQTVTGTVTDPNGEAVFGATVQVKGTQAFTTTDFDGKYSIEASPENTIIISYSGYDPVSIVVGNQTVIDTTLKTSLDAVVVTGYRDINPTKSSISQVTITNETIADRPNASFVQTMQGQVAGLNIGTSTGQPGANSLIQLRGVSSINGNTEPLFVIDGIPVDEDNFRSLNPNDIASITTLKDAAGTAIYGNRGANGVIVIKTRGGRYEQPLTIQYTTTTGFSQIQTGDYNTYDAKGLLRLENRLGTGRGSTLTEAEISAFEGNTDWVDYFFRTGVTSNHNLNFSQGGKNINSFTSVGLTEQEGILVDSKLTRVTFRNNLSGKSNNEKFRYGTNITMGFSNNDEPNAIGTGGVNQNYALGAFISAPYVTPGDYGGPDIVVNLANTPLFLIDRLRTVTRKEEELKIVASGFAEYDITPNLTARVRTGADYTSVSTINSQSPESFTQILFQEGDFTGFDSRAYARDFRFNSLSSLNYTKSFGGSDGELNTISAGAYIEYSKSHFDSFNFTQTGLDPKAYAPGNGGAYVLDTPDNDFFVPTVGSGLITTGLFSYFADVDYDYDNRFGFYGSVRRDASFRFIDDNTWGTFWAVAGRWNIDQEDFMAESDINSLKIRASYGTTGNERITGGYYGALSAARSLYAAGSGYGDQGAYFFSQIGNPDLRWEEITTLNLGVDFGVWNNRLRGSVEYYERTTDDLFQSVPISLLNGQSLIQANSGSLENRGFDLQLSYNLIQPAQPGDFSLTLNVVGNYNTNEILEVPTEDGSRDIGTNQILREGGVIGEWYMARYAGVNPANGNLLFFDINGDLTENPTTEDRIRTGLNVTPEYQGSFGFDMDYKNFFLTTQFNYVGGVDRIDFDLEGLQDPSNIGTFNMTRDMERAWTPDNRITDIPSLTATNLGVEGNFTDRYLRESDFVRLRFASFGYSFPKKALDKTFLNNARVFVNGENLVTFSKWRGFDPEIPDGSSQYEYPTPRIISVGLDLTF